MGIKKETQIGTCNGALRMLAEGCLMYYLTASCEHLVLKLLIVPGERMLYSACYYIETLQRPASGD